MKNRKRTVWRYFSFNIFLLTSKVTPVEYMYTSLILWKYFTLNLQRPLHTVDTLMKHLKIYIFFYFMVKSSSSNSNSRGQFLVMSGRIFKSHRARVAMKTWSIDYIDVDAGFYREAPAGGH